MSAEFTVITKTCGFAPHRDHGLRGFMRGDPKNEGINTRRAHAAALLDGPDPIEIGELPGPIDYAETYDWPTPERLPCRIAARAFAPGGLIFGAAGYGKSRLIAVIAEGWTHAYSARDRRLTIIDPKAETFDLLITQLLEPYWLACADDAERVRFAQNIFVNDVLVDRFTPTNLFAVPDGMSPSLIAELRAATTIEAFSGEFSDLMEYGVRLLYLVVASLGTIGITLDLVHRFFDDKQFREYTLIPKLADPHLRESLRVLEQTLPEQSRQAIVRRFQMLLATRSARALYGLSPAAHRALLPERPAPTISLQNFGPSAVRAPSVAIAQAQDAVVNAVNDLLLRPGVVPDMLITEETAQLVRNPTVARYLLDASRTLRWKGITLVCCAQDPSTAFPTGMLNTLALNAKWFAAFQSARADAALFDPFLPSDESLFRKNLRSTRCYRESLSAERAAFYSHMATLPPQHFMFLHKSLSAFLVKTRTVVDRINDSADTAAGRVTSGAYGSREELFDVINKEITVHSMVRYVDAERLIERETQAFMQGEFPTQDAPQGRAALTVDELIARVTRDHDPSGHNHAD